MPIVRSAGKLPIPRRIRPGRLEIRTPMIALSLLTAACCVACIVLARRIRNIREADRHNTETLRSRIAGLERRLYKQERRTYDLTPPRLCDDYRQQRG